MFFFLQNLGLKIHIKEFRDKIDLVSTHNLLCQKFAAECPNNATSCPQTSVTHNAFESICAISKLSWHNDYRFLNVGTISTFAQARFLTFGRVFMSCVFELYWSGRCCNIEKPVQSSQLQSLRRVIFLSVLKSYTFFLADI